MRWPALAASDGPLALAAHLDPIRPIPWQNLTAILRIQKLFAGRMLIPEAFLLHNAMVLQWEQERSRDLEEFLKTTDPIVSRRLDEFNTSFNGHYEASLQTGNPLLIPEDSGGRALAGKLDAWVQSSACRGFDAQPRLGAFQEHLIHALSEIQPLLDWTEQTTAAVQSFLVAPGHATKNEAVREQIDGFAGFTRGRLIAALREIPQAHPVSTASSALTHAAMVAYARIIMRDMPAETMRAGCLPRWPTTLGERSDEPLLAGADVIRRLVSSESLQKAYGVSAPHLLNASWSELQWMSETDEAKAVRQSWINYAGKASEYNLDVLVKSLDEYFRLISATWRGSNYIQLAVEPLAYGIGPELVVKMTGFASAAINGTEVGPAISIVVGGLAALLGNVIKGDATKSRRRRAIAEIRASLIAERGD